MPYGDAAPKKRLRPELQNWSCRVCGYNNPKYAANCLGVVGLRPFSDYREHKICSEPRPGRAKPSRAGSGR